MASATARIPRNTITCYTIVVEPESISNVSFDLYVETTLNDGLHRKRDDDIITRTHLNRRWHAQKCKKARYADRVIEGNLTSRPKIREGGGPLLAKKRRHDQYRPQWL